MTKTTIKSIAGSLAEAIRDHKAGNVDRPTYLDGRPVPTEEVARMHERLVNGDMKMEFGPGVREEMEKMGITEADMRDLLMQSTRKAAS